MYPYPGPSHTLDIRFRDRSRCALKILVQQNVYVMYSIAKYAFINSKLYAIMVVDQYCIQYVESVTAKNHRCSGYNNTRMLLSRSVRVTEK